MTVAETQRNHIFIHGVFPLAVTHSEMLALSVTRAANGHMPHVRGPENGTMIEARVPFSGKQTARILLFPRFLVPRDVRDSPRLSSGTVVKLIPAVSNPSTFSPP